MPTPWKRTPEDLHKTYVSNTEAFYKSAGRGLTAEVDTFMRRSAIALWSRSGVVTQAHVDAINELYSKGANRPTNLLWELTGAICERGAGEVLPPLFFWSIAESDVKRKGETSRVFVRMYTNILLYLAAVDDDVSFAEAEFITDSANNLLAVCDSAGVKPSRLPLRAFDFVTNSEPSFLDKHQDGTARKSETKSAVGSDTETEQTEQPLESQEELMAKLDALVGLHAVKEDVKSLVNLMKVRRLRQTNNLPVPPMSLHLVFTGNPGTGKTTVARLISKLYASIGVLSKGQLVEIDRSGLVAGYVGQTAIKTSEAIEKAMGGVLFIDEAYSLASGGGNDFGRESIETLLKAMEDKRDDLVVIVAGYDKPMQEFLDSNPGLDSRFNKHIYFNDYSGEELLAIFNGLCEKNSYKLTESAIEFTEEFFRSMYAARDDNFGNGREVRNTFEDMVSRQADRVAGLESPSMDDLMAVLREDLGGEPEPESEPEPEPEPESEPEPEPEPEPESEIEPESNAEPDADEETE